MHYLISKSRIKTIKVYQVSKSKDQTYLQNIQFTYLKIDNNFAHCFSHKPRFSDIPNNGGWQAKQDNKEVSNGQVHDEDIRHGPH